MKTTSLAALVAAALALPASAATTTRVVEKHGDAVPHVETLIFNHPLLAAADGAAMQGDAWKRWADDFSHDLRINMNTLFADRTGASKVVKGAPYGAEVVTEANQQLADGNVISRKTRGSVYRDGEGRTRQETTSDGKAATLHIADPVGGKRYVVTQGGKKVIALPMSHGSTATSERSAERAKERAERAKERAENAKERAAERGKEPGERATHRQVIRLNGTEIRIEDGRVFIDGQERTGPVVHRTPSGKTLVVENGKVLVDGKDLAAPTPPTPGSRNVIVQHVGPGETGDGTRREEVRVQVIRSHDGREIVLPPLPPTPPLPPGASGMALPPTPPLPPMPGIQTLRFESTAKLGKGVSTQLGNKEFDGVRAEGRSTVWTIPAGEVGNKNPINITSESWYSPELQVTVMSRYHDPRTGESLYRLANIQRGEPAADLFKVPEEAITKVPAKR